MELTPDRLACLRTIAANGGRLDHEDPVLMTRR
jgi:hypothetical protein